MKASELNRSSIVEIDGMPHGVDNVQVQAPSARGSSSIYKIRFRNLQTGQKVDKALRGEDNLTEASVENRKVQYLYKNGDDYTFMDQETYDQFDLKAAELEETIPFLVEDLENLVAMFFQEKVVAIRPPDTVELEIVECEPSIKGATAAARNKPAILSTGVTVQVPEYIAQGEVIKVDTRNKTFISRA